MTHILSETNKLIRTLTINRPNALNALNIEIIAALRQAIKTADSDPRVRVIILTGSGSKAFVAGADIKEFAHFSAAQGKQLAEAGQSQLFSFIEQLKTPVIAAINGFALGGGLELAMACHLRVASDNARMGLPEVSLGLIPGYGGTQRLPHLVGKGRATELIITGAMIDAQKALQYGLVNDVTTSDNLLSFCEKLALKIAQQSPMAVGTAIAAINAGYAPRQDGYSIEAESFGRCFDTDDFKEGTSAFLEKRRPLFSGS